MEIAFVHTVIISHNRLQVISHSNVTNARSLTLLQTLSPAALNLLPALTALDVSHNSLTRMEARGGGGTESPLRSDVVKPNRRRTGLPETLQTLDMSHNDISRIGGLQHCTNLRILNLSNNS